MDRLSPLDSLFLHVEDGVTHMHIASCAVFDGPAPPYGDLVDLVASKLPLLPRYRQKVRFVPAHLASPVWVDDPHFNLAYHVRHTALPAPGAEQELNDLMGRLMAVELDRHRPLWEVWMVEGLTQGRWALISKVHHCMVDGVSGTDLMVLMLDETSHATPPSRAPWAPRPEPSAARLAFDGMLDALRIPGSQLQSAGAIWRHPCGSFGAMRSVVEGAAALGKDVQPVPQLSIEGAIGPHRRWAVGRADLDELKAIRAVLGGTVNDVALSVIAGAFRNLLLARGDRVNGVVLRTLVPVSVRAAGDHTANNQVSAMIAPLLVGVADPVERLAETRRQMKALKASHEVETAAYLSSLAHFTPAFMQVLGLRSVAAAGRRIPQRTVHTVTTNVPGPQFPLYALGREMLEYLPFVPLSQGVRVGVAILSYNGQVRFGVTGDYDTVPEVAWFCGRIEAGIADLSELAGTSRIEAEAV